MEIWILQNEKRSIIGGFSSRELMLACIRVTYSNTAQPELIVETPNRLEWANGLFASLQPIFSRVDHL